MSSASSLEYLILLFVINEGADQHPHSLVSAVLIRFLKSKIAKRFTYNSSIFYLEYVAVQTGSSLSRDDQKVLGPLYFGLPGTGKLTISFQCYLPSMQCT